MGLNCGLSSCSKVPSQNVARKSHRKSNLFDFEMLHESCVETAYSKNFEGSCTEIARKSHENRIVWTLLFRHRATPVQHRVLASHCGYSNSSLSCGWLIPCTSASHTSFERAFSKDSNELLFAWIGGRYCGCQGNGKEKSHALKKLQF